LAVRAAYRLGTFRLSPYTCPQLYLTQLLMNLPAARMNELPVWLPDQWKQLHASRIANLQKLRPCLLRRYWFT
jgi:hypothetical protein